MKILFASAMLGWLCLLANSYAAEPKKDAASSQMTDAKQCSDVDADATTDAAQSGGNGGKSVTPAPSAKVVK